MDRQSELMKLSINDLSDIVHDLKSDEAASINNAGKEEQIKYITKAEQRYNGAKYIFEDLGKEVGALVDEKNAAYGNSFTKCADFVKLLYPNGVEPEQYIDLLCMVRIFDKQMRIATRKNAFDESPYRDITGYGLLGLNNDNKSRN